MSGEKSSRQEIEIAQLTETVEFLARALYLLPSFAAAVSLATPVSHLQLPDQDLEERTLLGMIGEFSDLRSATGVHPIAVIMFVALLVILSTGVVAAWPGEGRSFARVRSWRPSTTILTTAGIVLVLLALPLAVVLDSADHAANDSGNVPFLVQLGGIGMLALTGVVAVTVAQVHRKIRD